MGWHQLHDCKERSSLLPQTACAAYLDLWPKFLGMEWRTRDLYHHIQSQFRAKTRALIRCLCDLLKQHLSHWFKKIISINALCHQLTYYFLNITYDFLKCLLMIFLNVYLTSSSDVIIWRHHSRQNAKTTTRKDRHEHHYFHKVVSLLYTLSVVVFASIFPVRELKWVWMMI
jgi:hypothetical protein